MKSVKSGVNVSESVGNEYEDGRTFDPRVSRLITQQWVEKHMKQRESEFTVPAECTLFCGTWNVNAKKQEGGLNEWILPVNQPAADIYAIGFQEIVDLNAMNVALNSGNTLSRSQFWQDSIMECLQTSGIRYTAVNTKHLVGLLLCVFVKESIAGHVKDVRSCSTGVGIMGMLGNKGGVSIRLSLFDSSLCFVCSHLAAHRENVAGRNSDFRNIMERSVFTAEHVKDDVGESSYERVATDAAATSSFSALGNSVVMPRCGATQFQSLDLTISEHEQVFWLGDLNYRIDDEFSTEEVFARIESRDWEALRGKDQLNIERGKNNVFQGFEEGLLTFAPTYKYQPGTDVYETRADKKLRAPAWCDRVLWRTANKDAVRLVSYRRAALNPSDHKPVSAGFACSLRKVVESKERVVFQELVSTLNHGSSASTAAALPSVEVQGTTISIPKVFYEQPHHASVVLTNSGPNIAHWRFVPKVEDGSRVCKRWVSFDVSSGLLLPGETATVTVTVLVDRRTANMLNTGRDLLEDLIVLRIERSSDQYVSVMAGYERSCFGMALEELVSLTLPAASTRLPTLQSADATDVAQRAAAAANKLSIPKELWRLLDALWSGGALREKDLFNTPGDPAEVVAIRTALDRGTDLPSCSPHSIVDALLAFVASLSKPLLPLELYPNTEVEPSNMRAFSRKFLEELPPVNYNVFVYILSFLREVLAEEGYNRSTPSLLAEACVANMTYSAASSVAAADGSVGSGGGGGDFSLVVLSKDERARRTAKQGYLQAVITYLLSTTSSL